MLVAALLAIAKSDPVKASDYFPLAEGMRWTYRETGTTGLKYVDEVETPVTVRGRTAFPITSRQSGDIIGKIYYVVDPDSIGIVAETDLRLTYEPPRLVFKVGDPSAKWDYATDIPFGSGKAALTLTGTSKTGVMRRVFGEDVPAIEVVTDAKIRPAKGAIIKQHMVAYYAKGYGLVQLDTVAGEGREARESHLELTKFEPKRIG